MWEQDGDRRGWRKNERAGGHARMRTRANPSCWRLQKGAVSEAQKCRSPGDLVYTPPTNALECLSHPSGFTFDTRQISTHLGFPAVPSPLPLIWKMRMINEKPLLFLSALPLPSLARGEGYLQVGHRNVTGIPLRPLSSDRQTATILCFRASKTSSEEIEFYVLSYVCFQ